MEIRYITYTGSVIVSSLIMLPRVGVTPNFDHHLETRFEWGIMVLLYIFILCINIHYLLQQDVHINAEHGTISDVKIFSDSLFPTMIEDISSALLGSMLYIRNCTSVVLTVHVSPQDRAILLVRAYWSVFLRPP